ncbi:hypothetical protein [Candidatus Absconditicoccus praedator]|uniref:hypothetical protein n=1 Tax=Candidatus Absconditicoccus praedator TaxID=2735562 RepID=UPI001E3223CF|nr:hypothetical protein [Candidatus Absconditicoccus praedator]UFX82726.1 hypothetical protein HLG78_01060 [Candidatus Absconditicoccus praedator]
MKKNILYFAIIAIFLALGFGYYIFVMEGDLNYTDSGDGKSDKDTHISDSKKINLTSNIDFELDVPAENSNIMINVENLGVLSQNNALQQRVSFDSLDIEVVEDGDEETVEGGKLDIVSDEEKVYYKIPELDFIKDIYEDIEFGEDYIKVDNSQIPLEMLGELGNNELVQGIVRGLSTSNYAAYFEKHGIDQEIGEIVFNKGFYDLLFEEVDTQGDRKYLELDSNNCNVAVDVYNSASEFYPELRMMQFDEQMCNGMVSNANDFLAGQLYVSHDGDIETITYEGVFNFDISYQGGEIMSYNLRTPVGLNSDYEDDSLSIRFSSPFLQMAGHDVNFQANFDFEDKTSGNINFGYEGELGRAMFDMQIEDDKLLEYTTQGQIEERTDLLRWQGSGDETEGDFRLILEERGSPLANLSFDYAEDIYDFDLSIPDVRLSTMIQGDGDIWEFDSSFEADGELEASLLGEIEIVDNMIQFFELDLDVSNYRTVFGGGELVENFKFSGLYEGDNIDFKGDIYEINLDEETGEQEEHLLEGYIYGPVGENNTNLELSAKPGEEEHQDDGYIKGNISHENDHLIISGEFKDAGEFREEAEILYVDVEGDLMVGEKIDLSGSFGNKEPQQQEIANFDVNYTHIDNQITSFVDLQSMGEKLLSSSLEIDYSYGDMQHEIPQNYEESSNDFVFQLPDLTVYK